MSQQSNSNPAALAAALSAKIYGQEETVQSASAALRRAVLAPFRRPRVLVIEGTTDCGKAEYYAAKGQKSTGP